MSKQVKSRRKPGARQYSDYSKEMLTVAVDLVTRKSITSYEAEKQFGIPRRTILNKCKNLHKKPIGRPTKISLEEEKHIADVINLSAEFGCPLTLLDLRIVVYNYLEKNDRLQVFDNKMPGDRWARSFMTRHDFTQRATQNIKRCRAEKSVSEMIDFYKNLETSLKNIPPQNLLNFDETNLSDDPGASKAIFKRGTKHPERVVNSTKTSVSIMFAGTANGLCLPPYVVYKAEHLWTRWCRDGPPNARYNRTKSGWFDMVMFDDWFESIVLPWANGLNGAKLVIGDNLSSHLSVNTIKLCQENEIRFVFLPRNATHLTQPLDLAFFGPMKREWRKLLLQYKLSNPSVSSINKCHFPQLLKELMEKIDINNKDNLKSGFLAAGICPINPSKVTDKIPEATEKVNEKFDTVLLEYLQASRQLKPLKGGKNQMFQIIPGKSVSTEEAEIISMKQVKPAKVKSNKVFNTSVNQGNSETDLNNTTAPLSENLLTITKVSKNSKTKPPKVTLLSDVKFTKDNTPFRFSENVTSQLTEIHKQTDLFHITTINLPSYKKPLSNNQDSENDLPKKINTLVNVYGNLSNSDEENNINTLNSVQAQNKKKKLVKIRKKIAKKESHNWKVKQNKSLRTNIVSSTSNSEIDISIHSDSDLMDIDVILTDEDMFLMKYNETIQKLETGQIKYQELLETNGDREVKHNKAYTTKFDEPEKDLLTKINLEVNNLNSYNIGQTVLTRYYIKNKWKYYIGEIECINPNTKLYTISFYKTVSTKTGPIKFVMPKRNTDKDIVPEDCIVKAIEMLQISERPSSYVLMDDNDIIYFLK